MTTTARSTDDQPLLSVQHLAYTYRVNGLSKPALSDLSFDLSCGELALVLGGNGAGKSTLVGTLSGWLSTPSGAISLLGTALSDMTRAEVATHIALVRQDPSLGTASELTVAEHLALADPQAPFMRPMSRDGRNRFEEVVRGGALEGRLDQAAGTLSGGERQLLTVMLARLRGARLLLIDEGFSSLDVDNAKRCLGFVESLVDSRECGALMVTHDFHFASQSRHRLLILRHGRLIFDSIRHRGPRPTAEHLWLQATEGEYEQ